MPRRVRVITMNAFGGISIMSDFVTRTQAKKICKGRWGHIPGYVVFSSIQNEMKLKRMYGGAQ